MKKLLSLVLIGFTVGIAGSSYSGTTITASSIYNKSIYTIPKSLRGNWYREKGRDTVKFNVHSAYLNYHNNRLRLTPSMLFVMKSNRKGYYWIGQRGSDAGSNYKRATIKIRGKKYVAMRQLTIKSIYPKVAYNVSYYTHHKNLL